MFKSKKKSGLSRGTSGRPSKFLFQNNLRNFNNKKFEKFKSSSPAASNSFSTPCNKTFASMGSTNSSSNSTSQRDSGGKWRTLHVSVSPLFSDNTNKRKHNDISKHNIKLNTVTKQLFSDNQESMTVGNRMIPMQQLTDGIVNNLTCTKCSCSHQALAAKELYNDIANEFFPGDNEKKKKLRKKFEKYNRNLSKSSPRLHLSERTIGIATEIQCFCSVCGKEPIFETNASRTTLSRGYNANESYELNCMFLLALQLLGGGGADAEVILGFLNVPNGSTFRSRTFHRLEEKLSPIICRITRDEIDKALQEEVYLQLQKENRVSDYKKWLQKETYDDLNLPRHMTWGGNKNPAAENTIQIADMAC